MTVRTAELLMAIVMGAFSIYLMVKSTELPIGWIKVSGPGGAAERLGMKAATLASRLRRAGLRSTSPSTED